MYECTFIEVHSQDYVSYPAYMSSAIRQSFGKRVRYLRIERGYSLRMFALTIGINKSYLVDIEYGRKSPTLDTMDKIARGLDVTISFLVLDIDVVDTEREKRPAPRGRV